MEISKNFDGRRRQIWWSPILRFGRAKSTSEERLVLRAEWYLEGHVAIAAEVLLSMSNHLQTVDLVIARSARGQTSRHDDQ